MALEQTYERMLARRDELRDTLGQPDLDNEKLVAFSKELSEIEPVAEAITALNDAHQQLKDASDLLRDPDFKDEAQKEILALERKIPELEHNVQRMLIPKDIADERNAIIEVRAGTGGDEAALFAGLLFEMYQRYAEHKGWRFEVISLAESDLGGLKEGTALIKGRGVFACLKFESGVHRVQRVPQTESQGRIHTSAATVAVLPEMEEVDVKIDPKDLRIDTYRASGAGGQHVNKTDSAVRFTHIPTGIVVAMQDERSQLKNREKGMKILLARIYEKERREKEEAYSSQRKEQVGTGDRSGRIRTYNFPQGRVTDHRINLTLYKLDEIVSGAALDDVIGPLIQNDEAEKMALLGDGSR
ncbi:MAG: peptide chain release factor 1 [Bdellovibrionales bacterium]